MTNSSSNTDISIIIPLYNESKDIGVLLENLMPYKGKCEIIFVDGGSTDDTVSQVEDWITQRIVSSPSFKCLHSPKKGRAYQMNYGASHATGDILWFLHADSIPPADALNQIRDVISKGYCAACFRIKFDSIHPLMLYNSFMSNLRTKVRKIAFGDQGIFIKKSLFEKLGGYASIPLMEDYRLSLDIRDAGLSLFLAKGTIRTSERRYLVHGRLKTMVWMLKLQRKYRQGFDINELAAEYAQGPPHFRS